MVSLANSQRVKLQSKTFYLRLPTKSLPDGRQDIWSQQSVNREGNDPWNCSIVTHLLSTSPQLSAPLPGTQPKRSKRVSSPHWEWSSNSNQIHAETLCGSLISSNIYEFYVVSNRSWRSYAGRGRTDMTKTSESKRLAMISIGPGSSTQFKARCTTTELAGLTTTPCFRAKLHLLILTWSVCDWTDSWMTVTQMGPERCRPWLKKPRPWGEWL